MAEALYVLLPLVAAFFIGRLVERSHYASIRAREQTLSSLPAIATRHLPPEQFETYGAELVAGNVVVSVDYFKRFLAGLRQLVGGRLSSYETLVDRARREALLRMKEAARDAGAEIVFNVKLETSSIYRGTEESIGSVEVLAYGTALIPAGAGGAPAP